MPIRAQPLGAVLALLAVVLPASASAFCGFYVGGADSMAGSLLNTATQVVMMREGSSTVLSLQNDYTGPPADFALVVPVPVVLKKDQVKTLPADIFARVDRLAAPRLVEYWEEDPCSPPPGDDPLLMMLGTRGSTTRGTISRRSASGVTVDAQFAVGEYEIVVLSAKEAVGLDAWLRTNGYAIPKQAPALLAPYVAQGMKFFVAKVNPKKVRFKGGHAVLSPLRISYESKDFRLPVRLGLINSGGVQDLIVHVLARNQRYEVANYPNVTIPTNLNVVEAVRDRFSEFYAALFDTTLVEHPGAVVTEYAWQSSTCDPCPGPTLTPSDLATLGGDVIGEAIVGYTVEVPMPTVKGAVDGATIQRRTRQRRRRLRRCVERAARRKAVDPGEIRLQYVINPQGRVTKVKVRASIGRPAISKCVSSYIKRSRFPKPRDAGVAVVDQTLRIKRGPQMRRSTFNDMVLTRMHYRYSRGDLGEDLIFAPADPIVGGRETQTDGRPLAFRETQNFFQARYAIRHPWTGKLACQDPRRGQWGGPPSGTATVTPATDLAQVKRGALDLKAMLAPTLPR